MTIAVNLIREVDTSTTAWFLRVRCVRAYVVPSYGRKDEIYTYDCVFRDEENNGIQGTVRRAHLGKFRNLIREGGLYEIKNFMVSRNDGMFVTNTSEYKFTFYGRTKIKSFVDESFPQNQFMFTPFKEILEMNAEEQRVLMDVIGRIAGVEQPFVTDSGKRVMEIFIEDLGGARLTVTLWDEFIDGVHDKLKDGIPNDSILVVQFCRVKYYQGSNLVTNTYNVTQIIINGDQKQIQDFRSSIVSKVAGTVSLSWSSDVVGGSISNEFASGRAIMRNIGQILQSDEDGVAWVCGTIVEVEDYERSWYISCSRCNRKLVAQGTKMCCSSCGVQENAEFYRYKMQIRVIDDSGHALFMCWDKEATYLLGIPASEMKKKTDENPNVVPNEIENLADRKLLFKIQSRIETTRNFERTFSVLKMTDESMLIKLFEDTFLGNEDLGKITTSKTLKMVAEKDDGVVKDDDTPRANYKGKEKVVDSGACETVAKRSLEDAMAVFANKKRSGIIIKQEKDC